MFFKNIFQISCEKISENIIHSPVFFLVNRFQFRLEKTEDRIYESVAVNFQPFFDLISREFIEIGDYVVAGKGIAPGTFHTF